MPSQTTKESSTNMHHEYFELVDKYYNIYGKKTVLLMQVGAFFEVYGLKNMDGDENVSNSSIEEFSNICGLNISDKTIFDSESDTTKYRVMMAGFRDFTIDKYLTKLTDSGYTVVVYIQKKEDKKVIRLLDQIYSPGTFVSYETDNNHNLSNNIMCIWIERFNNRKNNIKYKNLLVCGCSVINVFTGEVHSFQYEIDYVMNITTFDELEKFVSVHMPNEVIIIHDFTNSDLDKVIQYSGIKTSSIHNISINSSKAEKAKNQKYMKEVIGKIYEEDAYSSCNDFTEYIISTQSMCYLFDFIQEHNPKLTNYIQMPLFNNTTNGMILANHTLTQLNIISDNSFDSQNYGNLSSVMSFLNKCTTSMGKRLFQYQLTHPTTNSEWLNHEYDMVEKLLETNVYNDVFISRSKMIKIRDIDKFLRQLVMKTLYPNSLCYLYDGFNIMQNVLYNLQNIQQLNEYIVDDKNVLVENEIDIITKFIDDNFIIPDCRGLTSITSFQKNIIRSGVSKELDDLIEQYDTSLLKLNSIKDYFNELFQNYENTEIEYVSIHEPEKTPCSLQITPKRSLLWKKMKESGRTLDKKFTFGETTFTIKGDDVSFVKASSQKMEISIGTMLSSLTRLIYSCREKLNEKIGEVYNEILYKFEDKYYKNIESVSKSIAKLDVIITKAYCAKEYRYVKPEIVNKNDKSYFDASGIRHCLIERLQEQEIYVDNDIGLGINNQNGVLLYGTNAVGKTSLIRSIGICVILAQSGMYVPCTKFTYYPYSAIFSRILGNDNLFKGLSTFAVEMSELRTILNLSDENSLILGDELCSGTETESALSIFVAGLQYLHEKESSFIFATHFHEIVDYEEIKEMNSVTLKHLEVNYNSELDCLVYDRKLKEGSGPRIYGLEVCKSLYMNNSFIERAFQLRNKYFADTRGILSGNKSKYNASKIKGMCEICKTKMGTEVHHLQQQKEADDDGFIGNFHKNHKANLVSICEECHDKMHNNTIEKVPTKKKKTTKGTKLF